MQQLLIRRPFERDRVILDLEFNHVPRRIKKLVKLKNEIIEIGAVRVDRDYNVTDKFKTIVKPQYNNVVDRSVFKLTSIQTREIQEAVELSEALAAFEKWLGSSPINMYTWSTHDFNQVQIECKNKQIETFLLNAEHVKWIDLQRIFQFLVDSQTDVGLHDAINFCGIELQGHEHDAFYDAIHTAEIAKYIRSGEVTKLKDAMESLIDKNPTRLMGGIPFEARKKLEALLVELDTEN